MADLYTSQVHLKRLLAGQATPAFTPAPEAVLKMLDPEFFPGMGALNEDDTGRLQCPVRECGEWCHSLAQHVALAHRTLGGVAAIRSAIGIPKNAGLISRNLKQKLQVGAARRDPSTRKYVPVAKGEKRGRVVAGGHGNPMAKNFADTCPSQLQAKLRALAQSLGRTPSCRDFELAFGCAALGQIKRTFGSWNAAKATCALCLIPPGVSERAVTSALATECLRAWVNIHGDLPTTTDIKTGEKTPRLPCVQSIKKAYGAETWEAAMRSAVEHLGITSERYGSPTRRTT